MSELGGVSVFILLVGLLHVLGGVMHFVSVIRLPARKISDACWWEGVWCAFGVLWWVALVAVCVGEIGVCLG